MDVTKAASQSHPKRKRRQSLASATHVFVDRTGGGLGAGGKGRWGTSGMGWPKECEFEKQKSLAQCPKGFRVYDGLRLQTLQPLQPELDLPTACIQPEGRGL